MISIASASASGFPVAATLDRSCALEELHHQIRAPVGQLVRVADAHDVGVVDAGGDLDLALEAGQRLLVAPHLGQQQLHRDAPLRPDVARLPHLPHAARAQLADELVDAVQEQVRHQRRRAHIIRHATFDHGRNDA